jgi:ankyrin repeat protein
VRPLRVEELAELLAFDFHASSPGGIPNLRADWRWDDHEEAVLSTCSSLITIVRDDGFRVVQFSHFSVKEYLTSPRLAQSHGDISRHHIDLEPAHTIMAQACLGTLLRLDEHAGGTEAFPLVEYAAKHWVEHARFEKVPSRVRGGMDDLFDTSRPHFTAWLRVHDMDEDSLDLSSGEHGNGSPLYYAAFCGLYDLVERLIAKHPEHVNAFGGLIVSPLPAALRGRHFHVADLLHRHGAAVDVRGYRGRTPLHGVSMYGDIDVMRWLLNHGADVNARQDDLWTPLHLAAANMYPEAIQVLLDHKADIDSRNEKGNPPLREALFYMVFSDEKTASGVVGRLLEHGADPNTLDDNLSTPLRIASSEGWLEVARLLLSHGANVDEKDKQGRTPFQVASSKGHVEMMKLLLDHGSNPEP